MQEKISDMLPLCRIKNEIDGVGCGIYNVSNASHPAGSDGREQILRGKEEYINYESTGGGGLSITRDTPLSFSIAPVRTGPGRRKKIPGTGHGAEAGTTEGILQGKAFKILY